MRKPLVVLVSVLLMAVAVPEGYAQNSDPTEPNNTIKTARPAPLDKALTLQLTPRLDKDYFKVQVLGSGVLSWTVKDWDSKASNQSWPYPRVYDAGGKILRKGEWGVPVKAGVYYISFSAAEYSFNERVVTKPFTVTFHFEQEQDPTEPNNTIKTARLGTFGQALSMAFVPRLDRDMVRLKVESPGIVWWRVRGWTGQARPWVHYQDGAGKSLSDTKDLRVASGLLYAEVRSAYFDFQNSMVEKPSQFTFYFASDPDPDEPANDLLKTAPTLRSQSMNVFLAPSKDVDHWWLPVLGNVDLQVKRQSGPSAVSLRIKLLDASGRVCASIENQGVLRVPKPGRYALRVTAIRHPGGVLDPVRLEVISVNQTEASAQAADPAPTKATDSNIQRWLFKVEKIK